MSQYIDDTFELADTLVVGFVYQLETAGTGPGAMVRLQSAINRRKGSLGRIRGLFVYDHTGRWLATSADVDLTLFNNSDRDYFKQHSQSPDKGPLIGNPVKSRSGGEWIITVSRRFDRPDGSFGGVVLASIDVGYFAEYFQQFDIGPHGAISLLSSSGVLLARSVDNDQAVNRNIKDTPLFQHLSSQGLAGSYDYRSPLDGVQRLSFYKRSTRFPVVVLVAESVDDVLSDWRDESFVRIAQVLGLVGLIAVIGGIMVRQFAARQRLAAALTERDADFRRLAEQSSDMVMRVGFDETIRYMSPSCARVVGWTSEQLTGTQALAGINPEDEPRVRQTVAAVKSGELDEAKMLYRTRHQTRGEIWLETAMHAIRRDDTGEIGLAFTPPRDLKL
ncbi:MAG: PAS domain S-box protein [Alphaproteobacteria bacterium]|nr:PAS domain S-box protein [Alphaproteobacteria bacterium]